MGIKSENVLNLQVGTKLIEECRSIGLNVINCTPTTATSLNDSLNQRVTAANSNEVAKVILQEIVKLGYADRGVKDGSGLFVIRETSMPAILIECAFVDSARDMEGYDTDNMAEAIFKGICEAFDLGSSGGTVYHTGVKGDTLWLV